MNIIIPMSGTGSRFAKKGYKQIKPLIPVFDKPIIQYIVEKFSHQDNFIFICREEHLDNVNLNLESYLNSLAPNTTVLKVDNHKLGPVHSLLQVKDHINMEEELVVNYCDFDWRWNYYEFKKWLSIEKPEAALCVYSGYHPHYLNPATYAYTRNNQHNVLEIREKESFTKYREEELAASGTFYFSSGKLLFDACEWLIDRDEKINGEFYVSLLFNYFPLKGKRTLTYIVNYFMQWGTPSDLEEFKFFARKVPLDFKKNLINCTAITLMAGKGNRMKSIDTIKKPYLEIENSRMFQLCTRNFISTKNNIFVINGDKEDKEYNHLFGDSIKIDVGSTKSSVETLFIAINKSNIKEDEEIFIQPCDASIDLDWDLFTKENKKRGLSDAIIFSFSNYPYARWKPNQYGWLKLNEDDSVKEIGYKKGWDLSLTNPIITGHFWFPNVGQLKYYLEMYLTSLNQGDQETSIDKFCQFLIQKNKNVFSIEVDDFLCLGTFEEFRTYEYWLEANEIGRIS